MKQLSSSKVQDATSQLRQGKSCRKVSQSLKISLSSVERIRNKDKGNIPTLKPGRSSKVSKRTRRYLAREFSKGELERLKDGQRLVQSVGGVHVWKQSILNYLRSEDMGTFIKQRKPYLTEDHKKARYQFAKDHLKWTLEDWKNVMFSDETIISRIGSYGRKYYFKKKGDTSVRPHHIKKTKQGGGGKMMVWGCITYFGRGDACWIPGKMNSVSYVEVLKDYVFASCDYYGIDRAKFIFQQDNAKIHTSKLTFDYIKKSNIPVMVWPPNSPDLNPMETVWSYLKLKLDRYSTEPRNIDDLWDRVQDVWNDIPIEFIQRLYDTMPERVKELYACKGNAINF